MGNKKSTPAEEGKKLTENDESTSSLTKILVSAEQNEGFSKPPVEDKLMDRKFRMPPVLDETLRTTAKLKILHSIAYDANKIPLLPHITTSTQAQLETLLLRVKHVLYDKLIPTLRVLLKHPNAKAMENLLPFLHIAADGTPNLLASFLDIIQHEKELQLRPSAVINLAAELCLEEVVNTYWSLLSSKQRHKLIERNEVIRYFLHDIQVVECASLDVTVREVFEFVLVDPQSISSGIKFLLKRIMANRQQWLLKFLFGAGSKFATGFLETVKIQGIQGFPIAEALVESFSKDTIMCWALRSKAPFAQHLSLWAALWTRLHTSEETNKLLNKWFKDGGELGLIVPEEIVRTLSHEHHLCLLSDLVNFMPVDRHSDIAMSILSYALANTNETILAHFFQWTPRSAWQESWEELLGDYVTWNDQDSFSSYCILLKNSNATYGKILGIEVLEEIFYSKHIPSPTYDQLETVWRYCDNSEVKNFLRLCLELCISSRWSANAFQWIWEKCLPLERKCLEQVSFYSRTVHRSKGVEADGSKVQWSKAYANIVFSCQPTAPKIDLSPTELFTILEFGQPYLFLLLWEHGLNPNIRENVKTAFSDLGPSGWIKFLGFQTGSPLCLKILKDKLASDPDVNEVLWKFLMINDLLSDYATAPCDITFVVEQLMMSLSAVERLHLAMQIFQTHCSVAHFDSFDASLTARHHRALLGTLLMNTKEVNNLLHDLGKNWITIMDFRAIIKLMTSAKLPVIADIVAKGDRVTASNVIAQHQNQLVMDSVCHGLPYEIPVTLSSDFEQKLVNAEIIWSQMLHINTNGSCVHPLNMHSPVMATGFRQDAKWLEIFFDKYILIDYTKNSFKLGIPSLAEYISLNSRTDRLADEMNTLELLLQPDTDSIFDERLVVATAKQMMLESQQKTLQPILPSSSRLTVMCS